MFRELMEAFRRRPLLDQMYQEMAQMLAEAVDMYRPIAGLLTGAQSLSPETHAMIYATDRRINHIQRKIRKQLLEHLTMSPGSDVPISLVLMSISKDAERIGDMCKNVLEVAESLGAPLGTDPYAARFRAVLAGAEDLFEPTVRAFCESDPEVGHDAVERGRKLAKDCDAIIDDLVKDCLPCKLAVLYALLARHLKRICSHLSNIATSVVMPFHRLDYFDEKWDRPRDP